MLFRKYLDSCGWGKNWGPFHKYHNGLVFPHNFHNNCLEFLFGLNIVLEQRVLWPHWKDLNCFTFHKTLLIIGIIFRSAFRDCRVHFCSLIFSYRAFSQDVTAPIYWCSKTMKRRPCWCSKPILWELVILNVLFLCKRFLFFQYICIDFGHASENALKSFLELAMNVYEKVFGFPCVCTHRTIQFGDFYGESRELKERRRRRRP